MCARLSRWAAQAARRSLWGPIIEKAAAKLHGSYEALNGGTFSEAFGMLTGMPVQTIRLTKYKPPPAPAAGAAADELAAHEKRMGKWRAKKYDLDELYAQLFSFRACGFVIGCSTFFVKEEEIIAARAVGIQVGSGTSARGEPPLPEGWWALCAVAPQPRGRRPPPPTATLQLGNGSPPTRYPLGTDPPSPPSPPARRRHPLLPALVFVSAGAPRLLLARAGQLRW